MNLKLTIKLLLWLIAMVILFHLAILTKLIPYEVTWGGRLSDDSEMYMFEGVSIMINVILGFTLLIKGEYILSSIPLKVVNTILWIFFAVFSLNTLGNIFSETIFEKSLSILTFTFSYLIWNLIRNNKLRVHNKS
ncbi:hypothetical protein N9E11_02295 [Crocinitomicaceae bacterium]|nr:hypothetical protein [Crocinitomicaceae bacterium]MDB4606358.1 hypothetical protein [Crocinitomicaceae bacterium]